MMKFLPAVLIITLMAGCKKQAHIEFSGTAHGVKSGVFTVKTAGDSTIFGENIRDEKFSIPQKLLNVPGYYLMNITADGDTDRHNPFEVYLEDGKYSIEAHAGSLFKYPKITSPSKIQEQLSVFYTMADDMSAETIQKVTLINKQLKERYASLSTGAYNKLLVKLQENQAKMRDVNSAAFKQFLKQYPQSDISAHILSKLDYESDPAGYYAIFNTLTPAAQNSGEGAEIGVKLSRMIKLIAGMKAPAIEGKTPDGKKFDPGNIHGKLIVIDFWRAGNELSRKNHDQITSILVQSGVEQNVAFISVSLDSKADWWATALKDDKLT